MGYILTSNMFVFMEPILFHGHNAPDQVSTFIFFWSHSTMAARSCRSIIVFPQLQRRGNVARVPGSSGKRLCDRACIKSKQCCKIMFQQLLIQDINLDTSSDSSHFIHKFKNSRHSCHIQFPILPPKKKKNCQFSGPFWRSLSTVLSVFYQNADEMDWGDLIMFLWMRDLPAAPRAAEPPHGRPWGPPQALRKHVVASSASWPDWKCWNFHGHPKQTHGKFAHTTTQGMQSLAFFGAFFLESDFFSAFPVASCFGVTQPSKTEVWSRVVTKMVNSTWKINMLVVAFKTPQYLPVDLHLVVCFHQMTFLILF